MELKLNRGNGGDGETCRRARGQRGTGEQCRGPVEDGEGSKELQPGGDKEGDECAECMVHCTVLKC